jgi:hypothetical protein
MKTILRIISFIFILTMIQSCAGTDSGNNDEELNLSEQTTEKETIESYVQKKYSNETSGERKLSPEDKEVLANEKEAIVEAINKSEMKSFSCQDYLDTLKEGIKRYRENGNVDVIDKYEEITNFPGFDACLEEKGQDYVDQWNALVDEVYDIIEHQ